MQSSGSWSQLIHLQYNFCIEDLGIFMQEGQIDWGSQMNIKFVVILCLLEVFMTGMLKHELNKGDGKSQANIEGESLRTQSC